MTLHDSLHHHRQMNFEVTLKGCIVLKEYIATMVSVLIVKEVLMVISHMFYLSL
jgi:hypothetical protein